MKDLELAYANLKAAQQKLARTRAEVEPRIAAISAQRDELRKAKEGCLMMVMFFTVAPMLIVIVIGLYRIVVGE